MADWTQVSRLGTGSFIPKGTQKPTEGTEHGSLERVKGAKSNYFRRNQMAKVTYRGVQYDTETRQKETKQSQKQLVYRGVAVQGAK